MIEVRSVDRATDFNEIKDKVTPMMKQYIETKEKNRDSLLFYRLGDFYEMFFDDAVIASKTADCRSARQCAAYRIIPWKSTLQS